ncbi:zinc finger protein basonuclin-2 isoform X2 [Bemisia tabaci]|uniref:zinc finger protein basonuclin-2 isoform X2 n=1 Tax=Bemisia tabaci TaxID=7038 RepID=UPI003B28279B
MMTTGYSVHHHPYFINCEGRGRSGSGARGGGEKGVAAPRMRDADQSKASIVNGGGPGPGPGLMMEVWASVASWFFRPENNLSVAPLTTSASSGPVNSGSSANSRSRLSSNESHFPLAPAICTSIRCTVPGCACDCFTPGKLHIRYCETCNHGWVPHALDKLGFRHVLGGSPVEPVQANVVFDIASLVLYGCQALPIRLKILLDRLFSVLHRDQVTQVLAGFGWSQEDYARGYILQEPHGAVLDKWNICSPEEEPLVLQQFLRFGETRAITQQLLLHGVAEMRLPRLENDLKKILEKTNSHTVPTSTGSTNRSSHKEDRVTIKPVQSLQPPPRSRTPPLPPTSVHQIPTSRTSAPPVSPAHQKNPLNYLKLPATGLTCTPTTTSNGPPTSPSSNISSPISVSPLNRLQNMQPFDYRKMGVSFPSMKSSPERRRLSDTSDTSPPALMNLCVTSPQPMCLPPPPPPVTTTSSLGPMSGHKSPSGDFSSLAGSSEFGSNDEDDDDSQNALNLSRDSQARQPRQRLGHFRKGSTPMKRRWDSSDLPLNLGTQLINPATGKKRVQCNVCLKTFCDKGALKIHFSAVHLREMHKCTVQGCNMMFSSRRSRNRHSANPNPKLHSPNLRRKISPHDGRSAQAHPMLIPPLNAGLNPLSFGPFSLLTPQTDPRNAASILDFKQSLDLRLNKQEMPKGDMNDPEGFTTDDDDEEGIVVDGGEDDSEEMDSEPHSEDKPEDMKIKRCKLTDSEADENENVSNIDSNEDSLSVVDSYSVKEENGENLTTKSSRKRKSQNPTRCTVSMHLSDKEDPVSEESNDNVFPSNVSEHSDHPEWDKTEDLSVKRPKDERDQDIKDNYFRESINNNIETKHSNEDKHEANSPATGDEDVRVKEEKENWTGSSQTEPIALNKKDGSGNAHDEEGAQLPNSRSFSNDVDLQSPAGSPGSSLCSGDSDEFGQGSDDFGDVPIDKENPRKCTACGKVFQNHFGVKTHYQNVHLKLMHKCTVEGCNASFPSKRSRDRHSTNLNLHRKLLSTSSDKNPFMLDPNSPFSSLVSNPALPHEFLARIYSDPSFQSQLPVAFGGINGDCLPPHPGLLLPRIPGFPGIPSHFSQIPGLNGKSDLVSPTSPLPPLFYNVDEDIPKSDNDGLLQCRFCSFSYPDRTSMKEHYEQLHLLEMFRCKVPGCYQVFSSRTKRNLHSANESLHHGRSNHMAS